MEIAGKVGDIRIAGVLDEQNRICGKCRPVGSAVEQNESAEVAADKCAFRLARLQLPPALVGDKLPVFLVDKPQIVAPFGGRTNFARAVFKQHFFHILQSVVYAFKHPE